MAEAEPQSWKEKYLQSLERFEVQEKQASKRLDLLRKGFVRVSLAADGLDEPLDDILAELRNALRETDDVLTLEPMIARLESCVIALDDHRKDDSGVATEMIDDALAVALNVKLPRKDKSAIKSFRKQLSGMLQGTSVNIDLWKGYLDVQRPVYDYLEVLEKGALAKKPEGLFQRLFSSAKEGVTEGAQESDNGDSLEEGANTPYVDDVEQVGVSANIEQPISAITEGETKDVDKGGDSESVEPETIAESLPVTGGDDQLKEELKSRTVQVFCGLVDQIETPNEFNDRKNSLVLRLQNDFDWGVLPELLLETMELVASTKKVAQLEFEGFLVTLHDRLQDIQDFLQVAREGEEKAQLNQTKLDQEVRMGLKEIKASVDDALDIGILKDDITSMVNQIVDVIDTFHVDERNRRDEVYDRIEMLGAKMVEMEAEATELRNNLEAQRLQAMRDPLTELPNRQAYDEQVEKEFSRWKRHDRSLSMVIVDIDFFKKINDTLGHLRGDKVLKLVAREIQMNIRSEDFVARYGGEEFVVLMPDTDENAACLAIEKVRAAIECCPFNFAGERVSITASFGVSAMRADDTVISCFDRVDKALYKAKDNGRNRIERG